MSTEKKLPASDLRRIALAMLNAAEWQVKVFSGLLNEVDGGTPATKEATTPPKKAGKGKAEPADDDMEPVPSKFKKTEPETEPEEEDDMFADDTPPEEDGPTLDEVRKVVKDFATKHGKEKALKLLGKFKVTSIPDIKKADWPKVIELAKKHL